MRPSQQSSRDEKSYFPLSYWLGEWTITLCQCCFSAIESARRLLGRRPVDEISTMELHEKVVGQSEAVVVIDVRSDVEISVSTIPGAISKEQFESSSEQYRAKLVVPFCTIGGRSYLYSRRLANQGFQTSNYRDGIIGWARSGHPFQSSSGEPTKCLHPYWRVFRVPQEYEVIS